eukprot:scaffold114873_cov56-Attheya_sp.AAC.2
MMWGCGNVRLLCINSGASMIFTRVASSPLLEFLLPTTDFRSSCLRDFVPREAVSCWGQYGTYTIRCESNVEAGMPQSRELKRPVSLITIELFKKLWVV